MKQSLLYYDVVGSVVHNGFLDDPPPDIAFLIDQGCYEVIHADDLDREVAAALIDDLVEVLVAYEREGPRLLLGPSSKTESLYYGKLPALVETALVDLGVLRDSGLALDLPAHLLGPLVCLLAKYAAESFSVAGRRYSMHTTLTDAVDTCLLPQGPSGAVQQAMSVTLNAVLPVPGDTESLESVLDFRTSHRSDLLKARRNLEEFIAATVDRGEGVAGAATLLMDEIEQERIELCHAMRSAGWTVGLASAVVIAFSTLAAHLAPGATPWVLSGVGSATISMAVVEARARPAPKYSYLHTAGTRFV